MHKNILKILIFISVFSVYAFLIPESKQDKSKKDILLQIVAVNGFGNNLYIDNISLGNRKEFDLAVTAVNNIKKDTTFYPYAGGLIINPIINITNLGINPSQQTMFVSTVMIPELGYISHDSVPALNSGQTYFSVHDSILIPTGFNFTIKAYISNPLDTNNTNDTLIQNSVFLQGAQRNILLEEFTSSTSPACGGSNFFLDTFITSNFQNICPVKYHCGFPPPGIDSMYIIDTAYVDSRREYYFCNTVPTTIYNGKYKINLPYYKDSNLSLKYNELIATGSPLDINITKQNISVDSVQASVNLNFLYPCSTPLLKLRAVVVERVVSYPEPIGASGESEFYDVYRKNLTSDGISISGNPGTQQFVFNFQKESYWNDTNIFILAYVQSDLNREVINSSKSLLPAIKLKFRDSKNITKVTKPDFTKNTFLSNIKKSSMVMTETGTFNFENFEGPFPPIGWIINDLDGFITFEKYTGVNGITFGGTSSMRIPFYDYSNIGQKDTIICYAFKDVLNTDTISFDYAYAMYLSDYTDSLIINISADGGQTYTNIFSKSGLQLSTANSTTLPFFPYSNTQWRTFHYPLAGIIPPDNPNIIVPDKFELYQNYPNPFNPVTNIKFVLKENIYTTLKIYDIRGRLVDVLLSDDMSRGEHIISYKPSGLGSGIYFYELKAGNFREVKKLMLIK